MTARAAPRPAWHQNPWVWGAIFGLLFVPLLRPVLRRVPAPPPVYGQLPDFALVDSAGGRLDRAALAGDVWVVGFFFTSCRSVCPRVLGAMASLQGRFRDHGHDVRLLAITVDPTHDTPEVLAVAAAEAGAVPETWIFATGEDAAVRALVEGGFGSAMGAREDVGGMIDIAHTERLALLDWRGDLRGWYSIDDLGRDEIFHRAQHVKLQQARVEARARRDG